MPDERGSQTTQLGTRWLKVQPKTLLRFFGIDYIFLYQFGVYLAIWVFAIVEFSIHLKLLNMWFLVAPPVVFAGYLIPNKWGVLMCASGDAVMSWGTFAEAWLQVSRHESMFGTVLTAALGLCMLVRFIRDGIILVTPWAVIVDEAVVVVFAAAPGSSDSTVDQDE